MKQIDSRKSLYLIVVKINATKSNVKIPEGNLNNWVYTWSDNQIIAYGSTANFKYNIREPMESLSRDNGLNLGLLIDVLMMISNQEVNTSISISTVYESDVYLLPERSDFRTLSEARALLAKGKCIARPRQIGSHFPDPIDSRVSITLSDDELRILQYLAQCFSSMRIMSKTDMKLLNYWRQGAELNQSYFPDQSYLAFYKSLEQFETLSLIPLKEIPAEYSTSIMKTAYRISTQSQLHISDPEIFKWICSLVEIRHNWDIAHTATKRIPKDRNDRFYYSHVDKLWGYHSDICELSRIMILRKLSVRGIALVADGGLQRLKLEN